VFRLRGILSAGTPEVDDTYALVPLDVMQDWLGLGEGVTDVVIRARRHEATDDIYQRLSAALPSGVYEVLRWMDIDPMVQQWIEFADVYTYVILMIVVAVVLAEVLNTMLMALHERVREFGLMEALGTRKVQLFAMMLVEGVILVMAGGGTGYVLGAGVALYFARDGIDLSGFADAFTFMYMSPVVTPVISPASAVKIIGVTLVAALLASVYPAWKATRLNPVEAMREI